MISAARTVDQHAQMNKDSPGSQSQNTRTTQQDKEELRETEITEYFAVGNKR